MDLGGRVSGPIVGAYCRVEDGVAVADICFVNSPMEAENTHTAAHIRMIKSKARPTANKAPRFFLSAVLEFCISRIKFYPQIPQGDDVTLIFADFIL